MSRILSTLGAVAALALVAGCGTDDEPAGAGASEGGRPANPPTTLAPDAAGEPVTLASGKATHDADVTIDRASGRIHVAWAQDRKKRKGDNFTPQDAMVAYSDDGGKTFSDPIRVNDEPGQVNAGFNTGMRIVSTGEDRVLVIWPYMTQDMSAFNVMGQLSTDGGKTWSKAEPVTSAGGKDVSELYGTVATWGKNVFVGFLDYTTEVTGIGLVHSSDGGKKFSKPVPAETSTCGCCDNAMTVNQDGTLFFAYRNMDQRTKNTQIRDTAIVRSYDKGTTWSDPVLVGEDNWEFNGCPESGPELAVDADNGLHGVYWTGKPGRPGVYYVRSDDDGATFSDPVAVAVDDFYPPPYVDLAVQDDGTGWIAWDDRRTKDRSIHLARVRDGKLETTDGPVDAGITPAIDTDGSMVAMTWSNDEGLHVTAMGEPKKQGFGSGPGGAGSGQDDEGHEGH